jgi:hypothetical protein
MSQTNAEVQRKFRERQLLYNREEYLQKKRDNYKKYYRKKFKDDKEEEIKTEEEEIKQEEEEIKPEDNMINELYKNNGYKLFEPIYDKNQNTYFKVILKKT